MATPARQLFRPPPSPARPRHPAASPTYRPRRPTATPLYPVVQHHLEAFLPQTTEADPRGNGIPWWVEKDFRAYLRCGILAHGFARARCEDCGHERVIPFSCKGRGICPSCNTRRMAELAAHLTDHVLPHLPVRQWVLPVPKRLRPFLHHNPDIAGAVLRDHASRGALLRAIRTTLRRASPGAPADAQTGAVSFLHRFGSSLNPHLHFHVVVLDGVFSQTSNGDTREARFHEATLLQPEHWVRLQGVLQRRVLRYFRTHGLLDELDALDILSWQGSGGFSIGASVRIQGDDRAGLERLLRYCARPPFALERLHALAGVASLASPDARLLYRFPKPTPDGRTDIVQSPLQLLERLVAFVPPPRKHRHRYHGVLAPHAGLRAAVVVIGRAPAETPSLTKPDPAPLASGSLDEPPRTATSARIRWAVLLARIYEVVPLLCPACGGSMSILAFLTDPPVVSAILLHLDLPNRPPPLAPARGPPQRDFLLDQSFDPADPEPVPDFHFDQSPPGDFDH